MKKHFVMIFFLIAGGCRCFSQQYYASLDIDSLKILLQKETGKRQVDLLNLLARRYLYSDRTKSNLASARFYSDKATKLIKNSTYNKGIGNAMLNEGLFPDVKDLPSLEMALALLRKERDDYAVAACYRRIGECYHTLGKFPASMLYYDSARILSLQLKDSSSAAWNTAYLGHLHFDLGNYAQAYKTGQEALQLIHANDTVVQTLALAHLGNLFLGAGLPEITIQYLHNILRYHPGLLKQRTAEVTWPLTWALERGGQAFLQLNQLDSAMTIANVLHIPFEEQDNTNHLFNGLLHSALHQYEKAMPHFKEGYRVAKQQDYPISLTSHAGELGKVYLALKQFDSAVSYATEALKVAQQIHALLEMKNAAGTLTEIYDHWKNYSKAYYYNQLYKAFNDSLAPEEYKRKLSLVQVQNEIHIQQQQAQILARDNQIHQQQLKRQALIRDVLLGSIGSFLLLGFIVIRNINLRRKNEGHRRQIAEARLQLQKSQSKQVKAGLEKRAAELEMQALLAQLKPNFIFNCLNAINRFILKNDSEPASDYLTKFSRLMRMVLNNSKKSFIALQDELEMLRLYIDMERLRVQSFFHYSISFKDDIDAETVLIPPMLLQPFAENAIWHGAVPKEGLKHLDFELSLQEQILTCTIKDDGARYEECAVVQTEFPEHKSMGLQLTRERLALLNRNSNGGTFFEIRDRVNENGDAAGTTVILKIMIKEKDE
jgi:hypothetical protein